MGFFYCSFQELVVTFIIIIINRCVKSSVLGAPLGSPGGETHTGEGLTVWGSPDGLWPSSLCLEVWRQGNGSLSLFFFFLHVFGNIFVLPLSTIIRQWKHQVYIFSTRRILISPGFPPPLTCTTRPGSTPSVWRRSILWAQSPERRPYMSMVMVHTSFSQLISIKITWIQVVRFLCNHYWGRGDAKQKLSETKNLL